ncbi:DUF58 domain-containing protein [Halomicrobium urmianum]|uniref:DUF58 domain-containing protein n=1 Tax=Halomicrobium urmianum TaxID=1586233 RepID=UPI001CD9752A|nr:DUF58 domain-containing protein [Halomicrobium urmianum]
MNRRRLAVVGGLLSLAIGALALAVPGAVSIGLDRAFVTVVGLGALVQALRVVQARRHAELDEAETPDPEAAPPSPTPGDNLESVVSGFLDQRRFFQYQSRVRDGLRAAAVAVLAQYTDASEAEARQRLDAGQWTTDRYAAAFLGDDSTADHTAESRLRDVLDRRSAFSRGIERTIDAITAIAGVPPSPDDEGVLDRIRGVVREAGASSDTASTEWTTPGSQSGDAESADRRLRDAHLTGHWRGVSVVALLGIGTGILSEQPAVLLAGVVGVGYAAFARSEALRPGSVAIERTVDERHPDPGDEVTVTVTVTNESGRPLPDVRLVDGVPAALAVADGSPRLGTALRSAESTSLEYTITARRGVYTFTPALIVTRDLAGAVEREQLVESPTTVTCLPPLRPTTEPAPLRALTTPFAGQVETATGGDGIEFHATREYRPGDPPNRIDWNRRARTGELTTVTFRQERSTRVVLLVDARADACVAPDRGPPHAVDRGVAAAGRLFASLAASGNQVGIAAVGSQSCWLAPDAGREHRMQARELLATHPALRPVPTDEQSSTVAWHRRFRKRLAPETQIVFCTPLCDDAANRLARRFEASGYPVTVVAPDPTIDASGSHRLARVARRLRILTLRETGVPVVDWAWDRPLDVALARQPTGGAR